VVAPPALLGRDAGEQPAPLARGTLGRRLVIRVTALVVLAAVLLSAATALATRQLLMHQIDGQLASVQGRQRSGPNGQPGGGPGDRNDLVQIGNPPGTIWAAYFPDFNDSGILKEGRGAPATLSPTALAELSGFEVGAGNRSVTLDGLGRYRVATYRAQMLQDAGTVVEGRAIVGIPLADVDRLMTNLIGLELVLTLLAAVGAVLAARAVVVRNLRALNRVAATAQQVSQLPLDRGEVALAVRVPEQYTDATSEVGRVGRALNHMLNNVEAALAARQASETKVRQFVADASHELRNPLAAIRGYAELTRRERNQMPENSAYAMSRVEAEAERMSYLVEDLLLLARLDSGPDLAIAPVDLTEVVINAVSDARAAGPEHSWQLDLPAEPVSALGDRHRLHQVMANLLANARTHTPPSTTVRSAISVAGGHALLTVTDNGPGIPDDIRDQVFERFTRAEVSRVRTPGAATGRSTGLGLAIVAAVVEAHHGTVSVQSRPGWTQFTVALPLAVVQPAPARPGSTAATS
jgi:two-component system OmpR family sensor kinase